ncbi:MAG: MCE family protein [Jatrophihabitans endophyticus]|nr:MCE family protein [Jatrophihabitans endophyticus]
MIKLVVFLVVTALATYVLAATISNQSYGSANTYKADFSDVTGLNEGDDVRIAGVRVGSVTAIQILRRADDTSVAQVTFTVTKDRTLPTSTMAEMRYRNLIGQRYIDIEKGPGNTAHTLKPGSTIPLDRTRPAVDLTVLFQGFQPLLQALDPTQINKLSYEIIATLQNEGGALTTLLAHLASLTNAIADKDKVIGSVIDNLTTVLTAVSKHDSQLSSLIVQLKNFLSGLASDRHTIGNAIVGINGLTTSTTGLLEQIRPPLKKDVVSLTGLASNLNNNSKVLKLVINQLAPTVAGLIRTASYGSWFNFYLCSLSGEIGLTSTQGIDLSQLQLAKNNAARCSG